MLDLTSLYELSDSICQVFAENDFESFVQLFLFFFVYADSVLSAPISPVAVFVALVPAVFPVCLSRPVFVNVIYLLYILSVGKHIQDFFEHQWESPVHHKT